MNDTLNRSSDCCIIIMAFGPMGHFNYHTKYWADVMTQKKINFQIYDFQPLMAKYNYKTNMVNDPLTDTEAVKVTPIISYSQLEKLLMELDKDNSLIVTHIKYDYFTFRIYRLISKNRLRYCVYNAFGSYINEKVSYEERFKMDGLELRTKFTLKNLIAALFRCKSIKDILIVGGDVFTHIPKKLLGINNADYILLSGHTTDSLKTNFAFPIDENTKKISCHFLDYDRYLINLENPLKINEKQVVYVSPNLFIHQSDLPDLKPEVYYRSLKKLFYILEKKGYSIIVAAHPRDQISELQQYLDEWEVVYGNTDKLIRDSEYAIISGSSITNMSLLYGRPFIMITSDSISQTGRTLNDFLVDLSNKLGKKLLNIDHLTDNIELDEYLNSDQTLVEAFISSKLDQNIPKLTQCQILLDNL